MNAEELPGRSRRIPRCLGRCATTNGPLMNGEAIGVKRITIQVDILAPHGGAYYSSV